MSRALPVAAVTIDTADVARFSAMARSWWDSKGPLAALHRLNPARLGFIRQQALARFDRDPKARRPFDGLRLLDVGCGGGLVCEPMARLGFSVTGLDASDEAIGVARAHAEALGLTIGYQQGGIEDLTAAAAFDLILALEVVEHVSDPAAFVRQCAAVLAPGGLLVASTLNRTVKSLALGKFAAEYLLRWAPVGAHDWRKFVPPDRLRALLAAEGLGVEGPFGVTFNLLAGTWRLSADAEVNYLMVAGKVASAPS